eukprot:5591293-Pyramimonas_sp.AAC.1
MRGRTGRPAGATAGRRHQEIPDYSSRGQDEAQARRLAEAAGAVHSVSPPPDPGAHQQVHIDTGPRE